jgi:hypothetical protein
MLKGSEMSGVLGFKVSKFRGSKNQGFRFYMFQGFRVSKNEGFSFENQGFNSKLLNFI